MDVENAANVVSYDAPVYAKVRDEQYSLALDIVFGPLQRLWPMTSAKPLAAPDVCAPLWADGARRQGGLCNHACAEGGEAQAQLVLVLHAHADAWTAQRLASRSVMAFLV